jgi:hypothetical protein
MHRTLTIVLACFCASASWAGPEVLRESLIRKVDPTSNLGDLLAPEGRSRWNLEGLAAGAPSRVRILDRPDGLAEDRDGVLRVFEGEGARGWLLPDRDPASLRMGARRTLSFRSGGAEFRAEAETAGIGWLHLPSGPREVVLERVLLLVNEPGARGFAPARLVHRFVDARAGVVAEISGPASADGKVRRSVDDAWVLDASLAGAADMRLYVDELQNGVYQNVFYGWDRGLKTQVSELTPEAYANVGALIAANTWNFSQNTITSGRQLTGTTTANNTTSITGSSTLFTQELEVGDRISLSSAPTTFALVTAIASNTSLTVDAPLGNGTTQNLRRRVREVAATVSPINSQETCNSTRCGYTRPGAYLERRDVRFGDNVVKYNTSAEREDRVGDVTIWLRAGTQKEGRTGAFGSGESRFCYDPTYDSTSRSNVPEWRFANQDPGGWFMDAGDTWEGGPFNCEQNLFNQTCGAPNLFDRAWSKACGTHTGKQTGEVLKGGVIVLPSGHTFNSLLVRTVADFCVYTDSACFLKVDEVRTVVYLWQAPYLGSVARVQSIQNAADLTSWSEVSETDFKFGLFPPVSIQATGQTDTTISISWDPGNDVRRIKDSVVRWDTDSGGASAYAFSSLSHPGQVSFSGSSATISGLTPGTTYFVTVTSRSDFTDPSSGLVTTYESIVYPTQVSGDPNLVYPVEVQATTTGGSCVPTAEVQDLRVSESNGVIELCWQPVSDPCLVGYDVLGAATPESEAGFTTVGQTAGVETCWSGTPASSYFLVVARGTGGNGPWGHFER